MIDPNVDPSGEDMEAYCRRRWGSSGWTVRLKQEGRNDGYGASFNNYKWIPNTMRAHSLIKFASEKYGIDTAECNTALFKALYEDGKNISLIDVLVQIAKDDLKFTDETGNELYEYLAREEGVPGVTEEIRRGKRQYDISGVPFFIIGSDVDDDNDDPPHGLSGAQNPQTFMKIFKELSEK